MLKNLIITLAAALTAATAAAQAPADWANFGRFEKEKEKGEYKPGDYIRGSLRDGNYARRRSTANGATRLIGIIGLLCLAGILIYFAKYFELLFS